MLGLLPPPQPPTPTPPQVCHACQAPISPSSSAGELANHTGGRLYARPLDSLEHCHP